MKTNKDYAREVLNGMLAVTSAMTRLEATEEYQEVTMRAKIKFEELPENMEDELFHNLVHEIAIDFQKHLEMLCSEFHIRGMFDELEEAFKND